MRHFAMIAVVGLAAGSAVADGIFESSYDAAMTFSGAPANLAQTSMNIAWDGSSYWTSSGGGADGARIAQFDASGALLGTFEPGVDMRSLATAAGGSTVYARGFGSSTVFTQTAPGVLTPLVDLSGGNLGSQSSVVISDDGSEFWSNNNGVVDRWNTGDGSHIGAVTLDGWGQNGESSYPQARGVATLGGNLLTYSNGTLSAWDMAGNRVGTTTLNGAGVDFDSHFSMGVANGMVWVIDDANGTWRGYAIPAPGALALLGLGGLAAARRRR